MSLYQSVVRVYAVVVVSVMSACNVDTDVTLSVSACSGYSVM